MRKSLSGYPVMLVLTIFMLSGCAGEKAAVKSEPAALPAAAKTAEAAVNETAAPAEKSAKAQTVAPDATIAVVAGSPIKRQDLDRALAVLTAQNRLPDSISAEQRKQLESATLDQLIFAELMYQQGVKTPPEDLEKQVDFKMSQSKGKFQSQDEFEAALKGAGITEKELAEITRKDLIIGNFIDKTIAPTVSVSDEEIKKFYDENSSQLQEPPQVRASHILIGVESTATDEEKKKAREKAEALLKEIKEGKDFAEVAKSDSTCPSKTQGGDLGFFGKGQMVAQFEQAAFGMKVGDISDIVETQFGYHIIKVTDKKDGEAPKLEELRDKITTYLKGLKTQKAVFDYVTKLRKEAKVEIML